MQLEQLMPSIVNDPYLHAKWLNTLSMMENTGARKISAGEHPLKVNLIVLKHAAEEARHAYYLKKQIAKLQANGFEDYSFSWLLAPLPSYHYLHSLDLAASRYLKRELNLDGHELSFGAYLLVTYAIEVRADALYWIYQSALEQSGSKVNVKSIILEEEGHLQEMIVQLKTFAKDWEKHAESICNVENMLYTKWIDSIGMACKNTSPIAIQNFA